MPGWQRLWKRLVDWVTTPWKVTATALAGLVIWYTRPILETLANEVLHALENPSSEPDDWLKPIATWAHRTFFVELIVVCEVVLVGTIILLITKFAFYIAAYIRRSLRKWQRTQSSKRTQRDQRQPQQPTPTKSAKPKQAPGRILALPKRSPDDGAA